MLTYPQRAQLKSQGKMLSTLRLTWTLALLFRSSGRSPGQEEGSNQFITRVCEGTRYIGGILLIQVSARRGRPPWMLTELEEPHLTSQSLEP